MMLLLLGLLETIQFDVTKMGKLGGVRTPYSQLGYPPPLGLELTALDFGQTDTEGY